MCGSGGEGATSSAEIARRLGIEEETLLSTEGIKKWMREGGLQSYMKVSTHRKNPVGDAVFCHHRPIMTQHITDTVNRHRQHFRAH